MSLSQNPRFVVQGSETASASDPFGVGLAKTKGIELGEVGESILAETEYFRVWDIALKPGQCLPFNMHYHPYLMVATSQAEAVAEIESIFGDKRHGHDELGRMVLVSEPAPVHQLTNVSTSPGFDHVTRLIEVKSVSWDTLGKKSWTALGTFGDESLITGLNLARERGIALGEVGHTILVDNDLARVWEIVLEPGETLRFHLHRHPYVAVTIEGSRTAIETVVGDAFDVPTRSGDMIPIDRPEPVHRLTNIGDSRYRSLLIEVKNVAPF